MYEFADLHPKTWVFWIRANTQTSIEDGFKRIAEILKLPGRTCPGQNVPSLVYNWLTIERQARWLIVLDGADDKDVLFGKRAGHEDEPLAKYLPKSENGSILITTRDKSLAHRLTGKQENIQVGPMSEGESLLLLKRRLEGRPFDLEEGEKLVEALDHIPLAISQAAAYMHSREPTISVGEYLSMFLKNEEMKIRLLKHDDGELRRYDEASSSVLITWQLSFDYIHSKWPSAADLLAFMSFFPPHGIPKMLLTPLSSRDRGILSQLNDPKMRNFEITDEDIVNNYKDSEIVLHELEDNIALLAAFCLISSSKKKDEFNMHLLVQLSMKIWLEANIQFRRFEQQYILKVATGFPRPIVSNFALCQQLLPLVEIAAACSPERENRIAWIRLLLGVGEHFYFLGFLDAAGTFYRKALFAANGLTEGPYTLILDCKIQLGHILRERGDLTQAEQLANESIGGAERTYGKSDRVTLESMDLLSDVYTAQGRTIEAGNIFEDMAERSYAGSVDIRMVKFMMRNLHKTPAMGEEGKTRLRFRDYLPEDHIFIHDEHFTLSGLYTGQDQPDDSEKFYLQILEHYKTQYPGFSTPRLISVKGKLATIAIKRNNLVAALNYLAEAQELYKQLFQVPDMALTTIMLFLADVFAEDQQWIKIEQILEEALPDVAINLGKTHYTTLNFASKLSKTYLNQQKLVQAREFTERTLNVNMKDVTDDGHLALRALRIDLAHIYWRLEYFEEAKGIFAQMIRDHPDQLVRKPQSFLGLLSKFAYHHFQAGERDKVKIMWLHILELFELMCESKYGLEDWGTSGGQGGVNLKVMIYTRDSCKRMEWWEGTEQYSTVLLKQHKAIGDHRAILVDLDRLVQAAINLKRFKEAMIIAAESVFLSIQYNDDEDQKIMRMGKVAITVRWQGYPAVALVMMMDCWERANKFLGPRHKVSIELLSFVEDWGKDTKVWSYNIWSYINNGKTILYLGEDDEDD